MWGQEEREQVRKLQEQRSHLTLEERVRHRQSTMEPGPTRQVLPISEDIKEYLSNSWANFENFRIGLTRGKLVLFLRWHALDMYQFDYQINLKLQNLPSLGKFSH